MTKSTSLLPARIFSRGGGSEEASIHAGRFVYWQRVSIPPALPHRPLQQSLGKKHSSPLGKQLSGVEVAIGVGVAPAGGIGVIEVMGVGVLVDGTMMGMFTSSPPHPTTKANAPAEINVRAECFEKERIITCLAAPDG